MKKKYLKCASCMYMLMRLLETKTFNKDDIINRLEISELDYYRYRSEVLNMLHDFGYYNILEEIKII